MTEKKTKQAAVPRKVVTFVEKVEHARMCCASIQMHLDAVVKALNESTAGPQLAKHGLPLTIGSMRLALKQLNKHLGKLDPYNDYSGLV